MNTCTEESGLRQIYRAESKQKICVCANVCVHRDFFFLCVKLSVMS